MRVTVGLPPSFGLLTPTPPQAGDYLSTLHYWRSLPDVLPIPDVARLVGHLCRQNANAIQKVIVDAVLDGQIRYWGQSHHGGWKEGMVRVLYLLDGKVRVRPSAVGEATSLRLQLQEIGRLHVEAMGTSPADAVGLLKARGRKVPDELLSLLADDGAGVDAQQVDGADNKAKEGPSFPLTRKAMIERHVLRWPSIERDLSDAAANGLSAAKSGARNWIEEQAVAWARSKGKYREDDKPMGNGRSIFDAPSRLHQVR